MLKVDWDYKPDFVKFVREVEFRRLFVGRVLKINIRLEKVAETNKGYHIYFSTDKRLSDKDILAIQLMLGSDWKREAYNLMRVWAGCKHWNVLFVEKWRNENGEWKKISEEKDITDSYRFVAKCLEIVEDLHEYVAQVFKRFKQIKGVVR